MHSFYILNAKMVEHAALEVLRLTGGLKMHDMKMQDWKMTDNILANYEQNYGVWKMQDWKMTDHVN